MAAGKLARSQIWRYEDGRMRPRRDILAGEEPLEIRLETGGRRRSLALTMRTPGNDIACNVHRLHWCQCSPARVGTPADPYGAALPCRNRRHTLIAPAD